MSKIFVLFGTESKVGVTMTSYSLALALKAKNPHDKILLCHLDGKDGKDFYESDKDGLGAVAQSVFNKVTSTDELLDVCDVQDNLYILPGFSDYMSVEQYSPEHFDYLMSLLESEFDYIVIDAGSNLNNGLVIGALDSEPYLEGAKVEKILVTIQQPSALKAFKNKKLSVFDKVGFTFDNIILNRYQESKVLPIYKQVIDNYGFEVGFVLSNVAQGAALIAEVDKKSMYELDKKGYRKEILFISSKLVENEG